MHVWAVPEALRPYVAEAVGYHDVCEPDAVHHGLPGPHATVVLALDEPLDVGWLGRPDDHDRFWLVASGLHNAPALIRTHGYQHGLQLGLTPLGVRALLGLPVGELAATLVHHDDLPLGIDAATHARLADTDGWDARFAVLEAHLLRVLASRDRDPLAGLRAEVGEAWRLLRRTRGRMPVEAVAGRVGWSRRYLAPRFAAEFGLGPKQAARVFRFHHARSLAESGTPLATAAATAGYADQAHLSRDWKALAGRTPTQWLDSSYHLPPG